MAVFLNTGGTFLAQQEFSQPQQSRPDNNFHRPGQSQRPGHRLTHRYSNVQRRREVRQGNLVNGSASFSTSTLAQGTHTITVSYSGDKNFNSNDAKPLVQVVNP